MPKFQIPSSMSAVQCVVGYGAFKINWRKFISEVHTEYNQLETLHTKYGNFTISVGYNFGLGPHKLGDSQARFAYFEIFWIFYFLLFLHMFLLFTLL